jgi:murein DD-endopeptidase MepM/ murein hydrolase activator NlpD
VDSENSTKLNETDKYLALKSKIYYLFAIAAMVAMFLIPSKPGRYESASILPFSGEGIRLGYFPLEHPTFKYGFMLDTFDIFQDFVKTNQTFGELLTDLGVESRAIEQIIQNCVGVFDVHRGLRKGKSYTVLTRPCEDIPSHLIFEPNEYGYVKFNLSGSLCVESVQYPVETKMVSISGAIESSLWAALTRQGVNLEAAAKMEDALQWSVDFSHALQGDEFKIVYDENQVEGRSVGAGHVHAAYYKREQKEYYAIWFQNGEYKGYYDLEGRPAAKGFLKSPVKYTRISSKFSHSRLHPILRYSRPHLGTDYAAPYGTPIYAVGDGTVTEASYNRGNGIYVKIKHDKVYQTQYLHMSRFARGIRRGSQVSQGQIIGYVGSTGLATGPHVCFRFWKNGVQVNHLKLELPKPKQLPKKILEEYFVIRDKFVKLLDRPYIPEEALPNGKKLVTEP